jgi:hypothetical protein
LPGVEYFGEQFVGDAPSRQNGIAAVPRDQLVQQIRKTRMMDPDLAGCKDTAFGATN